MKRFSYTPAIIAAFSIVTIAALAGAPRTYAMGMMSQGWLGNGQSSLIQKLVQRFNLKEADVQSFFADLFKERQTQMEKNADERLTQLVKDGKITEAQKTLIIAKQKELATTATKDRETFANKTVEERKQIMDTRRTELENWAKQNNINLQYLRPFGGRGMGGRGHMGFPQQ